MLSLNIESLFIIKQHNTCSLSQKTPEGTACDNHIPIVTIILILYVVMRSRSYIGMLDCAILRNKYYYHYYYNQSGNQNAPITINHGVTFLDTQPVYITPDEQVDTYFFCSQPQMLGLSWFSKKTKSVKCWFFFCVGCFHFKEE